MLASTASSFSEGDFAAAAAEFAVTLNDEWQNAALNYALTNIAKVETVDRLIRAMRAR